MSGSIKLLYFHRRDWLPYFISFFVLHDGTKETQQILIYIRLPYFTFTVTASLSLHIWKRRLNIIVTSIYISKHSTIITGLIWCPQTVINTKKVINIFITNWSLKFETHQPRNVQLKLRKSRHLRVWKLVINFICADDGKPWNGSKYCRYSRLRPF